MRVWHRLALTLAVGTGLLVAAPAFGQFDDGSSRTAVPFTAERREAVLRAMERIVTERAFVPGVDFKKWPEFLAKNREAIDRAEDERRFTTAVNQTLREFGISHIRVLTPRAASARTQTTTTGLGVDVRRSGEGLEVLRVAPNGPAATTGIASGDRIVSVNGAPATDPTKLTGDPGGPVKVTVQNAKGETREVEIERRTYSILRPDTLSRTPEGVPVIRIRTFATGYDRRNIENLMREAAKSPELIIDLRSNGGGALGNMRHFLSLLLPSEVAIGTLVTRPMADRYRLETGKTTGDAVEIAKWTDRRVTIPRGNVLPYPGRMVVLINRGTGSASEIVAAALREKKGVPLIGTRTAGAVLASTFAPLPDGFQLQFPLSDYVTIDGRRLEQNPIEPDVEVNAARTAERDPMLDEAVKKLRGTVLWQALWKLARYPWG